jgi:hypothetical protein|tara:strand:+ start:590 stop:769 length:180 start_codon:yes stop_codon:yes gene_type:complete
LNKKSYAFFLKKNRPRNRVAQELSDGRYQQRVIKNKKKYDRKKHSKISSRDSEWEMSDV